MRVINATLLAGLIAFVQPALADNERPDPVGSINVNAQSASAITISWNEPSDNVGIDGYNVYRNGNYHTTLSSGTSYTDNGVNSGTSYTYYVVAFDDARNYSTRSPEISVTANGSSGSSDNSRNLPASPSEPVAGGRPATPSNLRAQINNSASATLSWSAPSGGAEGYNIYIDGSYNSTVKGRSNYTANNLSSSRTYEFSVVAFRNNEFSTRSPSIEVRTSGSSNQTPANSSPPPPSNDDSSGSTASGRPAAPNNLSANVNSSSSATLRWSAPSGGAEGYNIYRDGSYNTTVRGSTSYTANNLSSSRSYEFSVVAFRNDEYSTRSSSVSVRTSGNSSPPPPNNDSNNNNNSNSDSVPANYDLVFSDEFNSNGVDSSKWNTSYRWGADFIINNEEQYYVDTQRDPGFGVDPFNTNGSTLTIEAIRTPDSLRSRARNQPYLSGTMTTFNKFRMTYGYVEMRAKMPRGQGLWPAFWLLHQTESGSRPEIDVVEMLGHDTNLLYQTFHYFENFNLRSTPSYQARGADYANDFHTYGMLWEPGKITWYVDGVATNTFESGNVPNESMYILLNLALGGVWAGSPDNSTPFPTSYEIDYVRAYQRR